MNSRDRGRVANVLEFSEEFAGGLMNTDRKYCESR